MPAAGKYPHAVWPCYHSDLNSVMATTLPAITQVPVRTGTEREVRDCGYIIPRSAYRFAQNSA